MKKIFNFTKKKKHPSGTPDSGSVLSVGYELKEKDLGKVHKAASVGDLAKLKQLAKKNDINQLDKENRTALHIACANGHFEVVQFLVESKAKLNLCDNQNRSALMKAVQGQHESCVSILLENHAEPSHVDINGNTALHLAANIPSISTAVLLLEHEADINAQNKEGFTPFTVAVREDHIEMAEFLLKEGANVNCMAQDQRSPLMIAAGNGQIGMLRLLLRFDADSTLKDVKGCSADDYAVMNGHHPCSLLIIEHGTQKNDGSSLSHQGLGKKKNKTLLGSPTQEAEVGFSLGGPASDKDDFEDNSQSESLSRVSKSAADEWPSSEDDDESVLIKKKPQKVNLSKMIAYKKAEASLVADRSTSGTESESENRVHRIPSLPKALPSSKALQHPVDPFPNSPISKAPQKTSTPLPSYRKERSRKLSERSGSQERSPEVEGKVKGEEEEEEEEDEEEEEEEEEDDDEEEEEENNDDDEEEEDVEEEEEDNEEEEEDESEEEDGEEENECEEDDDDDSCSASVEATTTDFKPVQKLSVTDALKIIDSADSQNVPEGDFFRTSGSNPDYVDPSKKDDKTVTQNNDVDFPAGTTRYSTPAALNIEDDCVVSAIRVESKFSDEDDSLGKEWTSDQNRISKLCSTAGHEALQQCTEMTLRSRVEEERFVKKDVGGDVNSGDIVWNDNDEEEEDQIDGNTVLADQRNVLPEDGEGNADSEGDAELTKDKKRRSSWGSSLEDSETDRPKENEVNKETLQLKSTVLLSTSTVPQPNENHPDTSWNSTPVVQSPKCVSPKDIINEPHSPQSINRLDKAKPDEWDSSDENNDQHNVSFSKGEVVYKTNVVTTNYTRDQRCPDGSWEEDKDFDRESNDPSPAVSSTHQDENTRNQVPDDIESVGQLSEMEGKSENEKGNDSSWDDEDESDGSEKKTNNDEVLACDNVLKTCPPPVNLQSPTSRPMSAIDNKLIMNNESAVCNNDEENQHVPLCFKRENNDKMMKNTNSMVPQTIVLVDKLDEKPYQEKTGSPTKDVTVGEHPDLDGTEFFDDVLPQTDIDDVDLDSADEAESICMKSHEHRDIEGHGIQKEDSTEDDDDDDIDENDDDKEDVMSDEGEKEVDVSDEIDQPEESRVSLDATSAVYETEAKKRDFLSELGLEQAEEQQDSWDSESYSDDPKMPHEEKRCFHTQDKDEIPAAEEEIKEIENNNNNDDNAAKRIDEGDTVQKETEKAKWEPLSVLSKLEEDKNPKTDLMEELGLGDVDDLEDASDWDSASTTSKRTLTGRRMAASPLEEFPEIPSPSGREQDKDVRPTAPLTPQRSLSCDKRLPSLTSPVVPHPQPRARKMVLQKTDAEEESDWEPDNLTSSSGTKIGRERQNIAELQAAKPGSPELSSLTKGSSSSMDNDEQQQGFGKETRTTAMEVQKSSVSWDTGGTALEEVGTGKLETSLGCLSSHAGAVHQDQQPAAIKSTSAAPVQLHLQHQQSHNSNKQEGTLQLELVRGARRVRAPQTNTLVNGDPLSVFDDSTLSEVSDDEGRLPNSGQETKENPEEVEMAEDFDELTQSSDTATDDIDSPTSGYRHASLLIQKLDTATLDSRSMVKLQNIFHEYERSIQKERSRHGYLADKVSQMEMERAELRTSLEEVKDVKSALERNQLELQTEVTNLKFQLKQELENRQNATMMYNTARDKLRRTEEQHHLEVQERQKVELTLRNLELEMRTLVNNMKQLEEDHSETQRLLVQERSARTLQENLLNSHLRKQQEIEEENKRNISKSNEALSQLTEASDRERELLHQTVTLQEQLTIVRTDLERLQANSSLKESHIMEENEALKEQLEDTRRDLKLNSEALTQTVFSCNNQVTTLKSELAITTNRLENERQTRETLEAELKSARTRLDGAINETERCLAAHKDTEKALLREKDEHQRLKDKATGEAASQREAVSSLSQKLSKAESHANSMENEVNRVTIQLTEKGLLLEVLQREKDQATARIQELEASLHAERELVSRAGARQEATQERLAQAQSEGMLLRQQLEEAQNKGVAKERAVTDAQERFSDILSKLRSDCEERVQLIEERNKELASKAADLRDQIYKLEEEKSERETNLRQLQQELADSLKKLSMSEATLEVNTRYRNDLEEEKVRLLKDTDRLKGKLEESEDQYVQAERRINSLKNSLDEREKELSTSAQKLQEALSASAASEMTIKQLEEAVQGLEIENARLEAAAKQQSNKIEALQKEAQEAAMVKSHLEDLVTHLQSSKMTLEDQLSREVQKQSMLSHTAQDSQALWEEELKSRSKLGLRLAELEKEKGELNTQMEIERKKAKKIGEQKNAVDTRLEQEMKRNTELQKEMYRLRTLLKTAKKKLQDQDTSGAEFGSPMSSLRMDLGRHSHAEGAIGRMKDKVDDLHVQLEKEVSRCSQLEKTNRELKDELFSLKSLSHNNDLLERSKRQLEEEVLDLRRRMEATQMEQSQVEQYRRDADERARQELQQKLEQVNIFLQSQAASQEALDQKNAANEANMRSRLEQKICELEGELGRARTTQQDSLNQRESTRMELERYRHIYTEELRLRKSLAAKLERANSRLAEANSKLLTERSRCLMTNGSLGGPSLDLGTTHYGGSLGPLNRSLGLGFSLLSPVTDGQNSRVEDYLAKMQSELDRQISKELKNGTAELDAASSRLTSVGSSSRVELDPVSRATQEYLEVLKKNYMI